MNKKDLIWAHIFYKLGQHSQPSPQEPEPSKDLESVDTLGCTVAVIIASAILGIALFFFMMWLHDPHRLIEPAPTQLPMPTECAELDHLQKFYLAIERVVSKSELIQRAESAGFVWREDYDLTDLDAKRTILWIASDPAVIQSYSPDRGAKIEVVWRYGDNSMANYDEAIAIVYYDWSWVAHRSWEVIQLYEANGYPAYWKGSQLGEGVFVKQLPKIIGDEATRGFADPAAAMDFMATYKDHK